MKRRSILVKTILLGISTLFSRFLGLIREILQARFLGVGVHADAFITAFTLPNTLRKIFAEGALSAALVPTMVSVERAEGKQAASALAIATLFVMQSFLLVFCVVVSAFAPFVVSLLAPGYTGEQKLLATDLSGILIYFLLFASAAAVFAAALQAVQRFYVPANSQIIMNILFIGELGLALYYQFSLATLAYCILFNGLVLVLIHLLAYRSAGLSWRLPDARTWASFKEVMKKFVPCLITVGSIEINLMIDRALASYLETGSVSLLYYATAFFRLPLGVFAAAFATILLPQMSSLAIRARTRLGFYLFEATKLIFWVMVPATLLMIVFSYKAFYTVLLSPSFTARDALIASRVLVAFSAGLFFFAFNKILVNLFYSLHDTLSPTIITLIGTVLNTVLNYIFMQIWGVVGIGVATCIAVVVQTGLFLYILHTRFMVPFYYRRFGAFMARVLGQVIIFGIALFVLYHCIFQILLYSIPLDGALGFGLGEASILKSVSSWRTFLLEGFGYWLWVAPLCALIGLGMYVTRKIFNIDCYFLG